MISLSDRQLGVIMTAARAVPHDKRSQFLERLAAMLRLRGRGHFGDVGDAVKRALVGLVHETAA